MSDLVSWYFGEAMGKTELFPSLKFIIVCCVKTGGVVFFFFFRIKDRDQSERNWSCGTVSSG